MITNKDIRVENGFLIINGDKFPLDGQSPETIMEIVEDNSDSTPTENSTAPVTSGGVYTAIGTKQDNLNFDDAPTENSTNPVKSGGVYDATNGRIKCGVVTISDQTVTANTHTNMNYLPVTLPATTIGVTVMDTPNSAWCFANVIEFATTYVSLGVYNSLSTAATGSFKLLYFYI